MNPDKNRLEKKLFEISCAMLCIVMLYALVQGWLYYRFSKIQLVEIGIIIIAGSFFSASRFFEKFEVLRIPMILLLLIAQIYFWFRLSGIYGPSAITMLCIGLIILVISPSKWRLKMLFLVGILCVTIVYLQYTTDWVYIIKEENQKLHFDYVVIIICSLILINYLKSQFDKEREMVFHQNKVLETLNKSLKESIEKYEKTIRKLNTTQEQLIDSEKMAAVGGLTAGLAHELNNPLNFIGGNIDPILKDLEEIKQSLAEESLNNNAHIFDEINLLLENVADGSRHASEIINNLLKISPRGSKDQLKNIHLNDLVLKTSQLLGKVYANVTISFDFKFEAYFHGNVTELNQVLLNLFKNAVDALEGVTNPIITVQIALQNDEILLKICDNGSGIQNHHKNQIFDPFFTTKDEGKGTGLGLYISYGIIQKHHGKMEYSPHDPGSCFSIYLPLSENK